MSPRRAALLVTALLWSAPARAADPKDIEAAIQKGAAFLKKNDGDGGKGKGKRDEDHLGARALAGLALLETGTAADDPAIRAITAAVRDAAFDEVRTYQLTLFVLYLDRLGDPSDRALIQLMGVRLVAGQNGDGGWTYTCVPPVPAATEKLLRARLGEAALVAGKGPAVPKPGAPAIPDAGKPGAPLVAGRLHAEVERYRQGLLATERKGRDTDDNSNTQFGVLGVWVARKYAVPVEAALERIEKRFLGTQTASGGWPYSGPHDGSPSMTCAGLLGLATAVARREERTLRADAPKPAPKKPDEPAKPAPPPGTDPNDPFFNPPQPKAAPAPEPPKKPADPPAPNRAKPDARDAAITRGMDNLAAVLAGGGGGGKGKGKKGGDHDLYFYWSLERVGVVFGVEKIGKTDWYEYGANRLLPLQNADGSFGARGGYGPDVNTAFALLFLARANPVRDLSAKVQKNLGNTEMRAGAGAPVVVAKPAPEPAPLPHAKPADPDPRPVAKPEPPKPATTPGEIAAELFRATGAPWAATLSRVRDAKGGENTSALLAVIPLLDGDRKKQARDALAERLCRMSANTLRGMLRADDAELRRAAALACAMKDDKDHVPDLIGLIEDANADVAKAARAALKSLTGQDLATAAEWRAWLKKEK
jgi:outer membrane biosynthesis protein TonB